MKSEVSSFSPNQFPRETGSFFDWLERRAQFWIRDLFLSGYFFSSRHSVGARKSLFQQRLQAFSSLATPHEGCSGNMQPPRQACPSKYTAISTPQATPDPCGRELEGTLLSHLLAAHGCDHDWFHYSPFGFSVFLISHLPVPRSLSLGSLPQVMTSIKSFLSLFRGDLG